MKCTKPHVFSPLLYTFLFFLEKIVKKSSLLRVQTYDSFLPRFFFAPKVKKMKQISEKVFSQLRGYQRRCCSRREPLCVLARSVKLPVRELQHLLSTRGLLLKCRRKAVVQSKMRREQPLNVARFHRKLSRPLNKSTKLRSCQRKWKSERPKVKEERRRAKIAMWEAIPLVETDLSRLSSSQNLNR